MICSNCKNETPDGFANCLICGKSIIDEKIITEKGKSIMEKGTETATKYESFSLWYYFLKCFKIMQILKAEQEEKNIGDLRFFIG